MFSFTNISTRGCKKWDASKTSLKGGHFVWWSKAEFQIYCWTPVKKIDVIKKNLKKQAESFKFETKLHPKYIQMKSLSWIGIAGTTNANASFSAHHTNLYFPYKSLNVEEKS